MTQSTLLNFAGSPARSQRGQGMTEYIIIVALIAVSAITVYSFFGQTIRQQTAGLAKEMAGVNGQTQITGAATAATGAATDAANQKGLATYANTINGAAGN
jgi:Flp pilus assembly pilin Flp